MPSVMHHNNKDAIMKATLTAKPEQFHLSVKLSSQVRFCVFYNHRLVHYNR